MARLLIYDSNATKDAAGLAVLMSLVNEVYRASKPVRLYGAIDGPINDIGYEFLFDGTPGVTSSVELWWYQEYFNDTPSRSLPTKRVGAGVNVDYPWAHEQLQYSSGQLLAGSLVTCQIEHRDIRRRAILADGTAYFNPALSGPYARCLYFPCRVHALFVRLQIAVYNMPASGNYRLRCWAVVGGHDQQNAQESNELPYAAEL